MSETLDLNAIRFAPARKSCCVAHLVYEGGTEFEVNPQVGGEESKMKCEMDRWGIDYVRVNVRGSRDQAKRVLSEGVVVPFQMCPNCQREFPAGARATCKKCNTLLPKRVSRKRWFRVADGYVRAGDGATMFLFESGEICAPWTPDDFRTRLGLESDVKGKEDLLKLQKYFKRFTAPVKFSVSGTIEKWLDNGFVAKLYKRCEASGGLISRITYVHTPEIENDVVVLDGREVPAKLFYDGGLRLSTGYASWICGRVVEDGEGLQVTVGEPKKLYKGLAECMKKLRWDAVLYMGKRQLHTQFGFVTFQVMTELHPSDTEYTDVQSVCALDLAGRLSGWAVEAMARFRGILNDPQGIADRLQRIMEAMTDEDLNDMEEPVWSLIQAHRQGLPITALPWARRRLRNFFLKRMLVMNKFRVPYPDWMIGVYGAVDRSAINEDGLIDPSLAVLKPGEVVIPFREGVGPCSIIRRPIGSRAEQTFGERRSYGGAIITEKCPYVYLSLWDIEAMVPRHGGFDFDDRFQVCLDPKEIELRRQSLKDRPYPVDVRFEEKPESPAVAVLDEVDEMLAKVRSTTAFARDAAQGVRGRIAMNPDHFKSFRDCINELVGRQRGLTIELVSNLLIVDNANLNAGAYEDNLPRMYRVSPNLEAVIDSNVHVAEDNSMLRQLLADIDAFLSGVPACEDALVRRLPKKAVVNGELVEVRSRVKTYRGPLTQAKLVIQERQKQWLQALEEDGNELMEGIVSGPLEQVTWNRDAAAVLGEMKAMFHAMMADDVDGKGKLFRPLSDDDLKELAPVFGVTSDAVQKDSYGRVVDISRSKKRELRKGLLHIYESRNRNLEDPEVRIAFEYELGVKAFKATQKEIWLAFDGKANTLQAVALGMKKAYCENSGGDGVFSGNHTVQWFIEVWNQVNGMTATKGCEQVVVNESATVKLPKWAGDVDLRVDAFESIDESPEPEPEPPSGGSALDSAVVAEPEAAPLCVEVVTALTQEEMQAWDGHDGVLVQCLYLDDESGTYVDAVVVAGGVPVGDLESAVTYEDVIAAYDAGSCLGVVNGGDVSMLDFSVERCKAARVRFDGYRLLAVALES